MDNSLPTRKSISEKKKMSFTAITTFYIIYRVSLLCSEYPDDGLYCRLLWMHSAKPESISTVPAHVVRHLIYEELSFLFQQINNAKILIFAVISTCTSSNFSLKASVS